MVASPFGLMEHSSHFLHLLSKSIPPLNHPLFDKSFTMQLSLSSQYKLTYLVVHHYHDFFPYHAVLTSMSKKWSCNSLSVSVISSPLYHTLKRFTTTLTSSFSTGFILDLKGHESSDALLIYEDMKREETQLGPFFYSIFCLVTSYLRQCQALWDFLLCRFSRSTSSCMFWPHFLANPTCFYYLSSLSIVSGHWEVRSRSLGSSKDICHAKQTIENRENSKVDLSFLAFSSFTSRWTACRSASPLELIFKNFKNDRNVNWKSTSKIVDHLRK